MKKVILLLLVLISLASAKSRVGFYTMIQDEAVAESQWIGFALTDLIAESIQSGGQCEVLGSEQTYRAGIKSGSKIANVANIAEFDSIKKVLDLNYLVTGSYQHQPDRSLSLTLQIHDFKENKTLPLAVQGYSNDIPTIISYIMGRVAKSLNLTDNPNELMNYRTADFAVPAESFTNYYSGIAMLHTGNFQSAANRLEEAYKNHLDNPKIKEGFDEALASLYGDGTFAMDLFNADSTTASDFKKQYLSGKKIASGFTALITGNKIERNGSYYSLSLDLLVKIDQKSQLMVADAIKSFQAADKNRVKNDVFNPNAKPELGKEMEKLFERNIGNSQLIVNCLDKNGNIVYTDKKSLKTAFDFFYKDDAGYTDLLSYKKIFTKTGEQKAQITLLNLSRDVIKKIDRITVSIR